MKYPSIAFLKTEGFPVRACCEVLNVSCSGFYGWANRKPSKREQRDEMLRGKVVEVFRKSKRRYGSPRIHEQLQRDGEKVGKDKVAKLMKESGLQAKRKKAFRPTTTVNHPYTKKAPRLFKLEKDEVSKKNQVWVSDLTYIPTEAGYCYLVIVMDLFNREIRGWNVADSMEAKNTRKALIEAVQSTPGALQGLTFHSDQGVQYCSSSVREKLKILGISQSMSRKGNCYDNAFAESFFHSLKTELDKVRFESVEEARKEIFDYVNWYNRDRLLSSLGYMSPIEYINAPRCAA